MTATPALPTVACGWRAITAASAIIAPGSSSSVTCSSRQTDASTAWLPAMLAVCENAARVPASVRPAFTISHGLPASRARRASATKRAGSLMPST
jgi:hypothetical protein